MAQRRIKEEKWTGGGGGEETKEAMKERGIHTGGGGLFKARSLLV